MNKRFLSFFSSLVIVLILCTFIWAQYPNVQVNDPASTSPEEVTISINPVNPQNLAAGANIDYYYYSFDGGLTWTEGNLTSSFGVWGDPCVHFDGSGNLYYGHLSNPPGGSWLDRIVVQKSLNGGVSWLNGAGIGLNGMKDQDKEWLASDMTQSPFRDNIYVSWTEFDAYGSTSPLDSSRILFSRSTDFGLTWSNPVRVSDQGGDCLDDDNTVEGAVPAVGPDGQVYVSWSGPNGIMFDRSLDGGVTFGNDVFVAPQPGGWNFAVPGIYRCNGFPITLCDVSNSPYRGTVYVVWSDQRNGVDNTDIFIIKSVDGGQTWGTVKRINDDTSGRQQFFVWATVDPVSGFIYAAFYDRRNTSGNATDVYVARSTDGGETFQNFKVSATSFTPYSSVFFGDYINIAALNGKVYPIWMRLDGTVLSVWTALIDDTPLLLDMGVSIVADFELYPNYPNPFNSSTRIEYQLPQAGHVKISVYNSLGQEVATLFNGNQSAGKFSLNFNAGNLPSGVYYYRLVSGSYSHTRKMILLR